MSKESHEQRLRNAIARQSENEAPCDIIIRSLEKLHEDIAKSFRLTPEIVERMIKAKNDVDARFDVLCDLLQKRKTQLSRLSKDRTEIEQERDVAFGRIEELEDHIRSMRTAQPRKRRADLVTPAKKKYWHEDMDKNPIANGMTHRSPSDLAARKLYQRIRGNKRVPKRALKGLFFSRAKINDITGVNLTSQMYLTAEKLGQLTRLKIDGKRALVYGRDDVLVFIDSLMGEKLGKADE